MLDEFSVSGARAVADGIPNRKLVFYVRDGRVRGASEPAELGSFAAPVVPQRGELDLLASPHRAWRVIKHQPSPRRLATI
jgi:hypothetical protein